MLADAGIDVGDAVDIAVRDGVILVTAARRVRGALDLERLVAAIPKGCKPGEVDWGPPTGREIG